MAEISYVEAKELEILDDPEFRRRCTKLSRSSNLLSALGAASILCGFVAFLLWVQSAGGRSRSGHYFAPDTALIPWAKSAGFAAVASLVCCFFVKSYYLADPASRNLYHWFWFLGWNRRRMVFRAGEVLGVTAEGRKVYSKYGSYWKYRVVAVGNDGRQEPLSNWRRKDLEWCNADARRIASLLGCASHIAPTESKPVVEQKHGAPSLEFESASKGLTARRVLLALLFIALGICLGYVLDRHGH